MRKKKRGGDNAYFALEICHSDVHLAVCREQDGRLNVHTQSLRWRQQAATLYCETGAAELEAAIRTLAEQNGLENERVYATLSGDYCVTRVVTGTEERVDKELDQLETRSTLYLTLGPGRKAVGGAIRQIDARHQHALLSVVNQKTLDLLLNISDSLQLEFELIEPSLSAVARFVGRTGSDSDGPTVIVNCLQKGVEVGISHKGQLLLDYRPTSAITAKEVAETLQKHLGRLQRYCDRYVRFTDGRLERVLLAGPRDQVRELSAAIEKTGGLEAQLLTPEDDCIESWTFQSETTPSRFAPTLGSLLLALPNSDDAVNAPNLLERLESQIVGPLLPASLRAFWPIAASIALVAVSWLAVGKQRDATEILRHELSGFLPDQQQAQRVQGDLARDQNLLALYNGLGDGLHGPKWNQLATVVTQCLPDDAWLEEITVTSEGFVELKGSSFTEAGVFRFRSWLRRYPGFEQVILNQTEDSHGADLQSMTQIGSKKEKIRSATRFDIRCRLAGRADRKEGPDGDT